MHDDRGLVSEEVTTSSSSSAPSSNVSEVELPQSSAPSSLASHNLQNQEPTANTNNNPEKEQDVLAKILAISRMDRVVKKKNVSVVTVSNTGQLSKFGKNGFPLPNSSNYKTKVSAVRKIEVDEAKSTVNSGTE